MLNYEEFKIYVKNHIKDYLPSDYSDADVSIQQVSKNNGLNLDAIVVKTRDSEGAPTVYLNEPYENYWKDEDIDLVVESLARTVENNTFPKELKGLAAEFMNFDLIKDRIIMVAVNADMNHDLLSHAPHTRLVGDLVAIYKVKVDMGLDDMSTCTVLNSHQEMWGISTEEIHKLAADNSKILMPATVKNMEDVIAEIVGEENFEAMMEENPDMYNIPEDKRMIVVSNKNKLFGATAIFYDDSVLKELTKKLGDKIYLLPSSVHEFIAIREESSSIDSLEEMVSEINSNEVSLTEQLSDHIYMYDGLSQKITLANEKVLQAFVSEDSSQYNTADIAQTRPRRSR